MKKVRYCYHTSWIDNLTVGSVYDVIRCTPKTDKLPALIFIKNDYGVERGYILNTPFGLKVLEDVTAEYRDYIIDEILT